MSSWDQREAERAAAERRALESARRAREHLDKVLAEQAKKK